MGCGWLFASEDLFCNLFIAFFRNSTPTGLWFIVVLFFVWRFDPFRVILGLLWSFLFCDSCLISAVNAKRLAPPRRSEQIIGTLAHWHIGTLTPRFYEDILHHQHIHARAKETVDRFDRFVDNGFVFVEGSV
jgi:hypothetical protein